MNGGNYGIPVPPARKTLIAPPAWRNYKVFTATTSDEVVPLNVYQMLFMVWGAGGWGYTPSSLGGTLRSGGGAGFAMGILDVTPGMKLPTITVASTPSGSSSVGALLSASGGSSATSGADAVGGTGFASPSLRGVRTASGGNGTSAASSASVMSPKGGSAGFWTGNGSTGGYLGSVFSTVIRTGYKAPPAASSSAGGVVSGINGRLDGASLLELIFNPREGEAGGDVYVTHAITSAIKAGDGGSYAKGGTAYAGYTNSVYAKGGNGGFGAPGGDADNNGSTGAIQSGDGGFGAPCGSVRGNGVPGVAGVGAGGGSSVYVGGECGYGCVIAFWTEGY